MYTTTPISSPSLGNGYQRVSTSTETRPLDPRVRGSGPKLDPKPRRTAGVDAFFTVLPGSLTTFVRQQEALGSSCRRTRVLSTSTSVVRQGIRRMRQDNVKTLP